MSEQRKAPQHLRGEELLRWAKARKPLFTESIEVEGMSFCFMNPELLDGDQKEKESTTGRRSP